MEIGETRYIREGDYYYIKELEALLVYENAKFREVDDDSLKERLKAQLQK